MNRYKTKFFCKCPINGVRVKYTLTIESNEIIQVEDLLGYVEKFYADGFHELIADDLHSKFGGKQTLCAYHHGVEIETMRGF